MDLLKNQEFDIAVVGGGIMGLGIAALASQRGFSVCLLRQSDKVRPHADTLRNQGWLQSGLMYVGRFRENRTRGRVLARQMYVAGLTMLNDLGLPPPSTTGILRVGHEADADRLADDADALQLKQVQRLDLGTVRNQLGKVFEEGIYYSIPDAPFPEAEVMRRLRMEAEREGVRFIQVNKPVRLIKDESTSEVGCQYCLETGICHIKAQVTVAASGAGNCELLKDLGIDPHMTLQQTPLLVVENTFGITAPIFADRTRGFSFVQHESGRDSISNGVLVVGTKVEREVPFRLPDERVISQLDTKAFGGYLPPVLYDAVGTGRFTAGYEVIPEPSLGLQHVEPWINWVEDVPGLLLAMPGRATMGMFVARQALSQIEDRLGKPTGIITKHKNLIEVGVETWNEDIRMHFQTPYNFDDSEQMVGGN